MRLSVCIAIVLSGCFTSSSAPPAPVPPRPVEVDDRPAPERSYRGGTTTKVTCDDDASYDCVVYTFTSFRDRACDCPDGDKVCGDQVMADMAQWSQDMAVQFSKTTPTPSPEQSRQLSDVANEFSRCIVKAVTPTSTVPPPP